MSRVTSLFVTILLSMSFLVLYFSTPSSFSCEVYLQMNSQRHNIAIGGILILQVDGRKYENLFQFNTSYLGS